MEHHNDCKTKKCGHCQLEKHVPKDFCKDKTRKDGFNRWCKACVQDYQKKRYAEKKEQVQAVAYKYIKNHREYYRSYSKLYYQKKKVSKCNL